MNINTYVRYLIIALTLTGCSYEAPTADQRAEPCTTAREDGGARITCPDGTSTFVKDGEDGSSVVGDVGSRGPSGVDGADGRDGERGPTGADGPKGNVGAAGRDGAAGAAGAEGARGADGAAGYGGPKGDRGDTGDIGATGPTGPQGTQGDPGAPGQNAPLSPLDIIAIVDPCGDDPAVTDEIFLKLRNGTLLASFSDNAAGDNTRFSVLFPGTFITTDGTHCVVTVHDDGEVAW